MLPGPEADAERILTNIEILDLTAVPKTLAIIGAGAVGVEFASVFNRFGTKVTVFEMLPRIVPVEDEEVSKELERVFQEDRHSRARPARKAENVRRPTTACASCVDAGQRQDEDDGGRGAAGGRRPQAEHRKHRPRRTRRSSWTAASSKWTRISSTGEPGVYAIGDIVAGTPQLAHVATMRRHGRGGAHGRQAGHAGQPNRIPGALIPSRASAASG